MAYVHMLSGFGKIAPPNTPVQNDQAPVVHDEPIIRATPADPSSPAPPTTRTFSPYEPPLDTHPWIPVAPPVVTVQPTPDPKPPPADPKPPTTTTPATPTTGTGTSTTAPANGSSEVGPAADSALITSLLGLVSNMYAGAGVSGGGSGFGGPVMGPISDTATGGDAPAPAKKSALPIVLLVVAISAGVWYWHHKKGKHT